MSVKLYKFQKSITLETIETALLTQKEYTSAPTQKHIILNTIVLKLRSIQNLSHTYTRKKQHVTR